MKIILSLVLLTTTVIARDLPQTPLFSTPILSITQTTNPRQPLLNKPQQGIPSSIPFSPGTSKADARQTLLAAMILTTMTDPEINMVNHKKNNSKTTDWKPTETKDRNERTYKPSQRNNPQGQKLSHYPGRYGGSQK